VTIYSDQLGRIIHSYTKLPVKKKTNPESRQNALSVGEDIVHLSMAARRKQLEELTLQQIDNLTRKNSRPETFTPSRLK
jgi:hypothetical protein